MNLDEIKSLIAEKESRIKLHDEVANITKKTIQGTSEENFPLDKNWSEEEFKERLKAYEDITSELCSAQILISFWGQPFHDQTIILPFRMIANHWLEKSGKSIWVGLKWHQNLLLLYYSGLAAIASNNYRSLNEIMSQTILDPIRPHKKTTMLQAILDACDNYRKQFKLVSGNPRHYMPRSEYIFTCLQPKLRELIYIESEYESFFDELELIMALEYAHQTAKDSPEYARGPIGRFGNKRRGQNDPLAEFIKQGNISKQDWALLRGGFFGGSYDRFKTLSSLLEERLNEL